MIYWFVQFIANDIPARGVDVKAKSVQGVGESVLTHWQLAGPPGDPAQAPSRSRSRVPAGSTEEKDRLGLLRRRGGPCAHGGDPG